MDESQKTLQRLERLRQLNTDRKWVNSNLYRLMYKEDLYILAYERIKSAPGNLTPGSDKQTMDGFSLNTIHEIIQEMRTEQFQFKPVRTVYIPKANGKKRRLAGRMQQPPLSERKSNCLLHFSCTVDIITATP